MDLGTANTIIIKDDKIVLDEPSVVAFDNRTGEMIAVGTKAREMYEKGNANIRTIRPLREGVIADFDAAEHMIRGMIRMISRRRGWFTPSLRMVVCIPSGSTEVEIRAVRDSSEHAGGRDVYMIYEPHGSSYRRWHRCPRPRRPHDRGHRWWYDGDRCHLARWYRRGSVHRHRW